MLWLHKIVQVQLKFKKIKKIKWKHKKFQSSCLHSQWPNEQYFSVKMINFNSFHTHISLSYILFSVIPLNCPWKPVLLEKTSLFVYLFVKQQQQQRKSKIKFCMDCYSVYLCSVGCPLSLFSLDFFLSLFFFNQNCNSNYSWH